MNLDREVIKKFVDVLHNDLELSERLSEADELVEKLYLISKIGDLVKVEQDSDNYYRENYELQDKLMYISRLNYILSRNHGEVSVFAQEKVIRAPNTITFEEFFKLIDDFKVFINGVNVSEEDLDFVFVKEELILKFDTANDLFRKIIKDLQQESEDRMSYEERTSDKSEAELNINFENLPNAFRLYYSVNDLFIILREKIREGFVSESEKEKYITELESSLVKISDEIFLIRELLKNNKDLLIPFYVIKNSLDRVEHELSLVVGEIHSLIKDLK